MINRFKKYKNTITIILAFIGIALMVFYDVYCLFCLAFAVMVIAAFIINYESPAAWRENRGKMWLYFLGEVDFPMLKLQKLPLLVFALLGYLGILFTFSGSVTPAYGEERNPIPSLGNGSYEVLLFSDYFCPPCRILDASLEPTVNELLAIGNVRITFIDVPFSKETPLYAKYYLYALHAGADAREVFRIRSALFSAAQENNIQSKDLLVNYLNEQKIAWKEYDEKPVLQMLNMIIKQNRIKATPTCVVRYSLSDTKKYVGIDEIRDGLATLKSQLKGQSCMHCGTRFWRYALVSNSFHGRTLTLPDLTK